MSAHGAYSLSDLQPTPTQQGHFSLSDLADAPSSDTYKPGALHAIGQDLGNLATSLPTILGGPPAIAYQGIKHDLDELKSYRATGKTLEQQQNEQEKAAGYGPAYRYVAVPAATAVGVNVPGMEQAAAHGDVGGVLGHTVVPMAAATAPLAIEGGYRAANALIPSTTRSGAGLATLESTHATQPVTPVLATDAASDIAQRLNVTGERPHPLIQTFQDRMNAADLAARHPEIAQGLADRGIDVSNPLTFAEARTFLKRANELKYDSNIGQSAKNQLSQFSNALDQDISAAAQQGGFGDDYAAMRNEYRRGSKIIRTADQVGPYVGAGLGYEVGRRMGEPIGGTIIGGMAGKALAKPVIGGLVRSVIERDAGAPALSSVPRSVPASPSEYTRTILNAKEGNISPGYADTLIKRAGGSTKVSPIDRSNVTPTVNAPPAPSEPATPVNSTSAPLATPPPPVRSAPISADKPPLPPNTVRVNVEGEDRMVKLSDDQMQKWNEAQARFQSSQDWARRSFANDPQEMQARLKGIGMRYAAEKRAITGQLTGRENAAIRARQATNYVGKPISLRGQNATVLGTAFGRIKVRLADGTTTTALPEDIDDPLPQPPQ